MPVCRRRVLGGVERGRGRYLRASEDKGLQEGDAGELGRGPGRRTGAGECARHDHRASRFYRPGGGDSGSGRLSPGGSVERWLKTEFGYASLQVPRECCTSAAPAPRSSTTSTPAIMAVRSSCASRTPTWRGARGSSSVLSSRIWPGSA